MELTPGVVVGPVVAEAIRRGTAIRRYVVDGVVGAGAMGVVYAAHDRELDRKVALKLVRDPRRGSARQRLLREAQALAQLSHPNVVAVYDVGTYRGQVFLAMEFVSGGGRARARRGPRGRHRPPRLQAGQRAGRRSRPRQGGRLRAGLSIYDRGTPSPAQSGEIRFLLARALWDAQRDRPRALRLADAARAELDRAGDGELAADVGKWIQVRH